MRQSSALSAVGWHFEGEKIHSVPLREGTFLPGWLDGTASKWLCGILNSPPFHWEDLWGLVMMIRRINTPFKGIHALIFRTCE